MGISLLFKKNKVKHLCGLATLECAQDEIWQLRVNDQHLHARNVVIATGSQPRQLPGVTIDNTTDPRQSWRPGIERSAAASRCDRRWRDWP